MSRPRAALAAAMLACTVSAQAAPEGPLPRIYFEAIADGSSRFGGDGGRFTALPVAPVMDGEAVYFVGVRDDGRQGIYRNIRGVIESLVDTRTPIPHGLGNFTEFPDPPMAADGRLVFRALGGDGQQGLYLLADGLLRRIADMSTAMPNSDKRFAFIKRPAFDGRQVVFLGRSGKSGTPNDSKLQGIYRYDLERGTIEPVADWTMQVPGRDVRFGKMDDTSTGRGRAVVTAYGTDDRSGIYVHGGDGLALLADTSTTLPGSPGEAFPGFNDAAADRSFETDNVAFRVAPEKSAWNGVYAWIDGTLHAVATVQTEAAGGAENFIRFRSPNVYHDRVFFLGYASSGHEGIYAWRNGKRFPVAHRNLELGGKPAKHFSLSQEAAGARGIAFRVHFEDGTEGIYLAHLRDEAGRVIISDTLHGTSLGNVQGGRFVEGGGWTVTADNDRIVWALPPMPPRGMVEVDIRNFDPRTQLTAEKNIFMGLWGTLFQNHERLGLPDTDNWEIRVGKAHPQFKVEYHARGFGNAVEWV
ncbi:MAG TPA: hypothetical protein VF460_00140, partial [Burkholderiales bacterium]